MKKVLSLILAVMMMFSVLSVLANAEYAYFRRDNEAGSTAGALDNQAVLKFNLDGGTLKAGLPIYNTTTGKNNYVDAADVPQTFVIVPEAGQYELNALVTLPSVEAPNGFNFVGWQVVSNGADKGQNFTSIAGGYRITYVGSVIEFRAVYESGKVEEDTFAKVFDILIKVFGTIIGLIAYNGNIEKGQDFVSRIFSSISG